LKLTAGLSLFGDWLGVQRPDRRLVVIAGHGNELIEDLALLSAGRSAVSSPNYIGQFSPCRERHLGSHSPSKLAINAQPLEKVKLAIQARHRPLPA
jgi:hypothetical protein